MDITYRQIRNNINKISKELQAFGYDDKALSAANLIVEKDKSKECLSTSDKERLTSINKLMSLKKIDEFIVSGVISEKVDVNQSYTLLNNIYDEETLNQAYQKRDRLFLVKPKTIKQCIEFFENIGVDKENLHEILFDAVILGIVAVQKRTKLVLDRYDVSFLVYLIKERMLYNSSFYAATEEALKLIFTTLSLEKAKMLLIENPCFLFDYKSNDYRNDYAYKERHNEALESIERYK